MSRFHLRKAVGQLSGVALKDVDSSRDILTSLGVTSGIGLSLRLFYMSATVSLVFCWEARSEFKLSSGKKRSSS